jgi:hypothetical protein
MEEGKINQRNNLIAALVGTRFAVRLCKFNIFYIIILFIQCEVCRNSRNGFVIRVQTIRLNLPTSLKTNHV